MIPLCLRKFPNLSAYQFVEDASETGVTNWFEHVDLNKERELTFREGYYSIHDTAREILENKEASDILVNALSSLIGYNLKKSMLAVMGIIVCAIPLLPSLPRKHRLKKPWLT